MHPPSVFAQGGGVPAQEGGGGIGTIPGHPIPPSPSCRCADLMDEEAGQELIEQCQRPDPLEILVARRWGLGEKQMKKKTLI